MKLFDILKLNNGAEKATEVSADIIPEKEKNAFLVSLENAGSDDFEGAKAPPKENKKTFSKSGIMRIAVAVVCFSVFVYCSYQIFLIVSGYLRSSDLYDGIADDYNNVLVGSTSGIMTNLKSDSQGHALKTYAEVLKSGASIFTPGENYEKKTGSLRFQQLLVFLENLRSENSDTYGYISIDGTKISFPVVQSTDNSYYLNHSFEKRVLKSGTIFADFRNNKTVENNRNLVLYGHNLSNGGMFHHVTDLLKEENFQNKDIILTTFDGIYTFKIFSVYKTTSTGQYFRVFYADDADFINWCSSEEGKSMYHKDGITFNGDSVILTLSTCISGSSDGRYAIHGILTEMEN